MAHQRVNVLITTVLTLFYDNGCAHTELEEPHQSSVTGCFYSVVMTRLKMSSYAVMKYDAQGDTLRKSTSKNSS